MLSKIEGIRRQLKKLLDKKMKLKNQEELEFDETKVKGELKGVDKRASELKEQLERTEGKLKTSMKSKRRGKKKEDDEEDEEAIVERRKNSDDDEDEYFDRTRKTAFNNNAGNLAVPVTETYESIK